MFYRIIYNFKRRLQELPSVHLSVFCHPGSHPSSQLPVMWSQTVDLRQAPQFWEQPLPYFPVLHASGIYNYQRNINKIFYTKLTLHFGSTCVIDVTYLCRILFLYIQLHSTGNYRLFYYTPRYLNSVCYSRTDNSLRIFHRCKLQFDHENWFNKLFQMIYKVLK